MPLILLVLELERVLQLEQMLLILLEFGAAREQELEPLQLEPLQLEPLQLEPQLRELNQVLHITVFQ
jgi:hypothetical protein